MTPSDWIAIGALVVAFVSIIFNHLTNKENIKARRAEIVTENSIDAHREIIEKLMIYGDKIGVEHDYEAAEKARVQCYDVVYKYTLYIPKAIYFDILKVMAKGERCLDKLEIGNLKIVGDEVNDIQWKNFQTLLNDTILKIQKHVGL